MTHFRYNKFILLIGVFVLLNSLTGCAGQMAFRDAKDLLSQNKSEEGLAKLKQAMAEDSSNLEYRKAYLQTRERIIYNLSEQADQAIKLEKYSDAGQLLQKVKVLDPTNEQAKSGLLKLDVYDRHTKMLADAQSLLEKNEFLKAQRIISEILAGNPNNTVARNLSKLIALRTPQNQPQTQIAAAYKKTLSIEFKDAPLRQIFDVISRSSGLNFLFDKDVKTDQKTSIFLKNSNIESAIHFTLLSNQLEQQILDSNTILIYPNTVAKQKDYQEMIVKSFFLTNADVKTVANTLKTIIKTRDIVVDEKLNMLIIRDNPEAIKLAEKLVALHDVAEPEVMLEVEVLEVKRTRLLDLGIQWPNSLGLTPLSAVSGASLTLRDLRTNINSSTLGADIGPATIKVRKEDGDANLLANPRIRARNHEKAKILIGERVPNITTTATSTGFVSESINYIDVGLKLDVEPTVYLDNDVAIKIALEVSSVTNQLKTQSGSVAYQIGTRTASTVLRLKNGETQVLAGLINDEERKSASKIPGLGELPVIGRLFGSNLDDNQKTEIVLSITPHLIRNIQAPEYGDSSFSSGTENNFKMRLESPDAGTTPIKSTINNGLDVTKPINQTGIGESASNSNAASANSIGGGGIGIGSPASGAIGIFQLQWQGPNQVKIGDTFALQLIMQSDQPVTSVPLNIGFNGQFFEVVSVTEGIFLKQGGAQTTFTSQVDPKGLISTTNSRTVGGASSPGGLVTVNLRALAPTDATPVQVISTAPVGVAGRALVAPLVPLFSIEIQP